MPNKQKKTHFRRLDLGCQTVLLKSLPKLGQDPLDYGPQLVGEVGWGGGGGRNFSAKWNSQGKLQLSSAKQCSNCSCTTGGLAQGGGGCIFCKGNIFKGTNMGHAPFNAPTTRGNIAQNMETAGEREGERDERKQQRRTQTMARKLGKKPRLYCHAHKQWAAGRIGRERERGLCGYCGFS